MKKVSRIFAAQNRIETHEDSNNKTPLHWAAANGKLKAVEKLIELGFMVSASDKVGQRPLHMAPLMGQVHAHGSGATTIFCLKTTLHNMLSVS